MGGANLISEMHQWEEGFLRMDNNREMLTILHRELEHKVEKVQHMKLEVMWPKTKSNMNFQPE